MANANYEKHCSLQKFNYYFELLLAIYIFLNGYEFGLPFRIVVSYLRFFKWFLEVGLWVDYL